MSWMKRKTLKFREMNPELGSIILRTGKRIMIDSYFRSPFQRLLVDPVARPLVRLPANLVTLLGCLLGVAVLPLLALDLSFWAFVVLVLSGYFDALDGTLARLRGPGTPMGTVLDICADRTVEAAVVIGLYTVDPARGLFCLLMLTSVLLCITSFLVVGIFSDNQSTKGFYYSPGLIERAEAFLFFSVMILFPGSFTPLAVAFAGLVLLTAFIRLFQFSRQCKLQRVPQEKQPPRAR
jgi:phosphatidylglycerophosphate synthase